MRKLLARWRRMVGDAAPEFWLCVEIAILAPIVIYLVRTT